MSIELAVRTAIKGQYHAALAMLGEAIRICPNELWIQGPHPREFGRIAYQTVFYAHLYLQNTFESFTPWIGDWDQKAFKEPDPNEPVPYTKEEVLSYWQWVVEMVDARIDGVDIGSQESGFNWSPDFPRLDHALFSFRHIQEHTGQLRDRLMEAGLSPQWVLRGNEPTGGWA